MGLFARKDPAKAEDPTKAHAYMAPKLPPSSGHVACALCNKSPDDALHAAARAEASEMHWS